MLPTTDLGLAAVLSDFIGDGVQRGAIKLGTRSRTSDAEVAAHKAPVDNVKRKDEKRLGAPTPAQREALLKGLEGVSGRARRVLWLWGLAAALVMLLAIGLTIYHRDAPIFANGSLFVGSGALMGILTQARSIHSRLIATEVLLALLPNLPLSEWTRVASVMLEEFASDRASPKPSREALAKARRSPGQALD